MKTSVIGYPRIGANRELKFATEKYFRNEIDAAALNAVAASIRLENWRAQQATGINYIPSGDFSFYDQTLDVALALGIVPARYRALQLENELDLYFAMARGRQTADGDVRALAMKKWFNTNYHYIVPELEDDTEIRLVNKDIFAGYQEAKSHGIATKPTLIGPFTLLKLCRATGKRSASEFEGAFAATYAEIVALANSIGIEWLQFEEPALVCDLTRAEIETLARLFETVAAGRGGTKLLLQTYFGDVRDCWNELCALPVDGLGIDFVEGVESLELLKKNGFPKDKTLFAGLVNGKNIWRNNYAKTLALLDEIRDSSADVVLGTSCTLALSPVSLRAETKLPAEVKARFAFAEEKLDELKTLAALADVADRSASAKFQANTELHARAAQSDPAVQARVAAITPEDSVRRPEFAERERVQKEALNLPPLPTTTIGSFPQTTDVRQNRAAFRKGELDADAYETFVKGKIADCIRLQEELGLDVLVHGEFERNDMVEYFGENLEGFVFAEKAWVQSYGTRCVKPPVVFGDVSRRAPMTVRWFEYAQSLTDKPVKGMLTGPVTILNWSFPREDVSLKEQALQLALAIQDEVCDLEAHGARVIQIDEAALREKLPLRKSDWQEKYLSWAIPAFRIVHSKMKPSTQIHTHMCYSEFADIIEAIDNLDADVITFEASRSDLQLLDVLREHNFRTEVGPGVYDIHSPRVPSVDEITTAITKALEKVEYGKLWANPDCGLKTRGESETVASLRNLVEGAKIMRERTRDRQ